VRRTVALARTTTPQRRSHAPEDRARLAIYRDVNVRDEGSCRCCGRFAPLDGDGGAIPGQPHHIVERSLGGDDATSNLCVVCRDCHRAIHDGTLAVAGDADSSLTMTTTDGRTWKHAPGEEHPHARQAYEEAVHLA
jgi:5-methylcytosine-specific restriction endonuclease McrA